MQARSIIGARPTIWLGSPLGKNSRRAKGTHIRKHRSGEINPMLNEGELAPEFTALDHTGKEVKLSDFLGKKVWLWFFSSPGGGN